MHLQGSTCFSPIEAEVDNPNSSENPFSLFLCLFPWSLDLESEYFRFVKLSPFLRILPENPKFFPPTSAFSPAIPAEQTAPIFTLHTTVKTQNLNATQKSKT